MATMTANKVTGDAPIILRLRKKMESWLAKSRWTYTQLLDWLKGYELPAVGHSEESYVWMLRALPPKLSDASGDASRREIARRLAAFIDEKKPYLPTSDFDAELLYNLLSLCAGLRCPDELGRSLYAILDHFKNHERDHAAMGEQQGWNLRGALRNAITPNQPDTRFKKMWEQMIIGHPDAFLLGNRYSGFYGLAHMPVAAGAKDTPAMKAIGWGLARMANYLEGEKKNRHEDFQYLLNRAKSAWPSYRTWDADLLDQTIKHRWPKWATVCLDSPLVAALGEHPDGGGDYLLWDFYLPYLEGYKNEQLEPVYIFPDSIIARVRLGKHTTYLLNNIYCRVETARAKCSNQTYQNIVHIAGEDLKNLRVEMAQHRWGWEGPDSLSGDSLFYHLSEKRAQSLTNQSADQNVRETFKAAAASVTLAAR